MSPVPACTLVSNNYLALARVLAESYRAQHPGARFVTCVVDARDPHVRYDELPFETLFAADLGIADFANLSFRYNVLELNTAVKPFLLEALRTRHGFERVFYLDPDILVLAPLDGLAQALERGSAVLTPHVTAPLDDARSPSERTVLMCGVYNLGFLGLRLDASTEGFLRWWQERLRRFCVHDVDHGLFVDQSWMDLAPAFLPDVQIVRDPAFNVAYWNLAHRFPRLADGRWTVGGRPLAFFHFSGLPFDQLERVSRYQDRIDLRQRQELLPLFEDYRARVLAAGHEAYRGLPYGYGRFADGTPVPDVARRALQRVDPQGTRWRDPFDLGPDSFFEWLQAPVAYAGGRLNRLLLSLWDESDDLGRRFPEVLGHDLAPFVEHVGARAERLGVARAWLEGLGTGAARSAGVHPRTALPSPVGAPGRGLNAGVLARPGELAAWLDEPIGDTRARPRLTRTAMMVYDLRADVRRRYPDPTGRDRRSFAYWLATDGAREHSIDASLLRSMRASLPLRSRLGLALRRVKRGFAPAPVAAPAGAGTELHAAAELPRAHALGVNLVGDFTRDAAAQGARLALAQAGVPLTEIALDRDPLLDLARGRRQPASGAPHAITLIHAGPAQLADALRRVPAAAHAPGHAVGYWSWDFSHFPVELGHAFDLVDEVWAPSRFACDAVRSLARVPVRLVPPCLPAPPPTATSRAELGWEASRFVFLASVEMHDTLGHDAARGLLQALAQVQSATARPLLLSLALHGDGDPPAWVRDLATSAASVETQTVTHGDPRFETRLAQCDAYVVLHGGCALGERLIAALMLARPVVATGYGGVCDYLDESSGYPVPYSLGALRDAGARYPGALRARPDVAAAAAAMTRVVAEPEEAAARARAGQRRVREAYGVDAAAPRLRAELERLWRAGPQW